LYGFRHPRLQVATFFIKMGLRRAADNQTEMLAVGSSDNCAVLFPTDERNFSPTPVGTGTSVKTSVESAKPIPSSPNAAGRPIGLRRTNSGTSLSERL